MPQNIPGIPGESEPRSPKTDDDGDAAGSADRAAGGRLQGAAGGGDKRTAGTASVGSERHIHGVHSASSHPAGHGAHSAAAPDHDKTAGERLRRGALAWLKEVGTIIVIALVLSFLIKTFLFRAYWIPSGSMENTLEENDRIFVNLLVPRPFALERGDIVVFKDSQQWLPPAAPQPAGPLSWVKDSLMFVGLVPDESQQHLVKRVIGLPGDRVICCDAGGKITVNGQPLNEPYLYPGAAPADPSKPFDVTVPPNELWVMGDHRNNSADSRAHVNTPGKGFVPISDVEGRATVIAWPFNRLAILGNYPDVFGNVPAPSPAAATGTSKPSQGR
ncbi:signal peptidase I [Arthrobacter sp. A5]|uniref:signal peptidase I n=1 Tax=Arthrobacter sp. A5 TaxID=576926 RepID=UPI003DA8CC8E